MRQIKERQIKEAKETLAGLTKAQRAAEVRRDYYLGSLDGEIADSESCEVQAAPEGKLLPSEIVEQDKLSESHNWELVAQVHNVLAAGLPLLGEFDIGTSGWAASPVVKWRWGGLNLAAAAQATSHQLSILSTLARNESTRAAIKNRNIRRAEDWKLQAQLACKEIRQIGNQITAAEVRKAIAEKELENHDLQTENAEEVDAYMQDKFTSRELYGWMISQISALYFQSYQLAYDLAKRAERAYRHELGLTGSNFIQFGYWDSLKKGLLAGEKLHYDLKRMDVAYLEQNKREYELTKHISLAQLQPEALLGLRETGECFFHCPEVAFDLDYPGHYMRRIKSVSVTLASVTGPYTNVNCTLTLQSNRIRKDTRLGDSGYAWNGDTNDDRFSYNLGGIQSIATSGGREDSGLFELNFRDERYLPFEGAGVISSWHLALPRQFRQFDYDTIADAILHVRYTARDGGAAFAGVVNASLEAGINRWLDDMAASKRGLYRMVSLRQEFASELHRFLYPASGETVHETQLTLGNQHFPYFLRGRGLRVQEIHVVVKPKEKRHYADFDDVTLQFGQAPLPPLDTASSSKMTIDAAENVPDWGGLPAADFSFPDGSPSATGDWALRLNPSELPLDLTIEVEGKPLLNPDVIEDMFLVLRYEVATV